MYVTKCYMVKIEMHGEMNVWGLVDVGEAIGIQVGGDYGPDRKFRKPEISVHSEAIIWQLV